ncbi:MAG TPA: thiamine phosphate synthase [Acidimicrobiales bacterium]
MIERQPPGLPPLLVVTDAHQTAGRALVEVVGEAISGGARAVLLREKDLPHDVRAELARSLYAQLEAVGGVLLVGSDPTLLAHGVHLAAADLAPAGTSRLLGRSCHSRDDVARAEAEGCSYATLSPMFASASKPGYGPALALSSLYALPLPTFALGGVDATNAAECLASGARGVAVMGAIMRAADPAAVTADILKAVGAALG